MKLLIAVLVLLLGGCAVHVSEKNLVRNMPGDAVAAGTDGNWTIAPDSIRLDSGTILRGAHFTRPGSIATVLYFGGNGFVLGKYYQFLLDTYKAQPVDVVAYDYRGYGGSTGTASLKGMFDDGVVIYDHVRAMPSVAGKPLVVHGQSIGSFVAGNIASKRTLNALVLESSATTAEDWVQGFVDHTWMLRKAVVDADLKGQGNARVMSTLDEPVLIVVGKDDTTTRPDMSEKLFKLAAVPADWKELLIVPGAGHNNASKSAEFNDAFSRLLKRAQH